MKVFFCEQTHSSNIIVVSSKDKIRKISNCDGLFTNENGIKLCIKTADCVPLTFKDKNGKVVGVVHSGWRGAKLNISGKAVNVMVKRFHIEPQDILVRIGPSIDKDSYLVGHDVARHFLNKYKSCFKKVNSDQWKMNLKGIVYLQLIECGLLKSNIKVSNISTYKNINFPSYRRDKTSDRLITSVCLKDKTVRSNQKML